MDIKLSETDMMEAMTRSGYLLESEIARILTENKYFVESNQVIIDPLTGKNREIDLIAEDGRLHIYDSKSKVNIRIQFLFEIKNNLYPLVLLTKQIWTPNIDTIESIKTFVDKPDGILYDEYLYGFYQYMLDDDPPIYTQYCSFIPKKGKDELMANHPEEVYVGLQKITQYCEEQLEKYNDSDISIDYFRNYLFLPILLLNNDLYELINNNNSKKQKLKKTNCSRLVFNYHYKNEKKSCLVYIITKEGLLPFLKSMHQIEKKVGDNMVHIKKSSA